MLAIAIIIGIFGAILVASFKREDLFQRWTADCRDAGGFVQAVKYNGYECFVDGEVKTLPGYEKYSTGIR